MINYKKIVNVLDDLVKIERSLRSQKELYEANAVSTAIELIEAGQGVQLVTQVTTGETFLYLGRDQDGDVILTGHGKYLTVSADTFADIQRWLVRPNNIIAIMQEQAAKLDTWEMGVRSILSELTDGHGGDYHPNELISEAIEFTKQRNIEQARLRVAYGKLLTERNQLNERCRVLKEEVMTAIDNMADAATEARNDSNADRD